LVGPRGGIPVVNCWGWPKVLVLVWEKGVWNGVVWTNGGVVVAGLVCGMETSTWVEDGMFGSVGSYGVV
jgi:hypothetical protein